MTRKALVVYRKNVVEQNLADGDVSALDLQCPSVMVRPAAGRIGEWTGLDLSACFGVSLFRHEIVGYKGHGLVRERVLHLR